ncbi:MAG TPA: hypothetical protein HA218_02485 [Nanoarchaeota archaeon]|nr:hypothetical protein [Nanoarchaeota archaeon]
MATFLNRNKYIPFVLSKRGKMVRQEISSKEARELVRAAEEFLSISGATVLSTNKELESIKKKLDAISEKLSMLF